MINHTVYSYIVSPDEYILFFIPDVYKANAVSDIFPILRTKNLVHTQHFLLLFQDLWEKQFGAISTYNLVPVEKFLNNMHHVLNDKILVRRAHSFLPYLFKVRLFYMLKSRQKLNNKTI